MRSWRSPLSTLFLFIVVDSIYAEPATLPFSDCFSSSNGDLSRKFNIDTVYGQVLPSDQWGMYLNLTLIGSSPQDIIGFTNESDSLATIFTSSSVLTLSAWSNSSYLCEHIRPPSPLAVLEPNKTFCPITAGPFALSSTIPWGSGRGLTTLTNRIRAVDPFSSELLCVDISTTPLSPQPNDPFGDAIIIFWSTVGLTIAYWLIVGIARIVSAWGRGLTRSEKGIWSRAQSAGFILASAISGERLATSPALMRFCTPSMRDIIFHTQWCAALAMVAVQWPNFVYPLLSQTAWSTLIYNITVTPGSENSLWDTLSTFPYNPPQAFTDQLADPSSLLYINPEAPNLLFTLPNGTSPGIESLAYTIGVRPQDLFGVCLILFLGIIAGTIAISVMVWLVDHVACLTVSSFGGSTPGYPGSNPLARVPVARSPISLDPTTTPMVSGEESKSIGSNGREHYANLFRPASRATIPFSAGHGSHAGVITSDRGIHSHRSWWRIRSDLSSFHGSVMLGNLVRILVLFHLPVTIFSCFHMTLPRAAGGTASGAALAALSFAFLVVLIPAYLVYRVRSTSTNKLYDETRTLLAFGPLYNHYRHGSQMFASLLFATNIAFGVTIGAGQGSGTAQAIIILVVEVISALVTSIWLPWGSGAGMGLISFLFCVARIVVAVLVVILTPAISIGPGAGGWIAYGILVILALVYLALVLMLLTKIFEAFVRIFGGVGFDRSKRVVDSGLLGALGLLGCCGSRDKRKKQNEHSRNHRYRQAEDGASQLTQPPSMLGLPVHRDSDGSSYLPQADVHTPPRFLGQDQGSSSRKGSTHSGPPPSVLRPEHALRPYREDDNDDGYIMGAWQPFSRTGYSTVTDGPLTTAPGTMAHSSQPPAPKTGFSRVGGGKAHMDTPYAIASRSTHTFPSVTQQQQQPQSSHLHVSHAPPVFYDDDEDSPPPSVSNVGRHYDPTGLPPGAMQPAHIRTKSQSAVIEDASLLVSPGFVATISPGPVQGTGGVITEPRHRLPSGGLSPSSLLPSQLPVDTGNDSDEDETQPKKKHWYQFGRKRVQSGEGLAGMSTGDRLTMPSTAEGAPLAASGSNTDGGSEGPPQPTRSFVVIRKNQPSTTTSDSRNSRP